MKLSKLHITHFRCIDDSTDFSIAPTTCLVGKNESGKTAILQALERLNPLDPSRSEFDKLRDYPRAQLTDYEELHPKDEARVLETRWTLADEDADALEAEFGDGVLKEREITVSKSYAQTISSWRVPLDSLRVLKNLIDKAGLAGEERSKANANAGSEASLIGCISAQGQAASEHLKALGTKLANYREQSIHAQAVDILGARMPKFLYFSSYDRMSGRVHLETLAQQRAQNAINAQDAIFVDFLSFAGTTIEELGQVSRFEDLKARVEAASIKISRQIFEYWSQNRHLKVEFTVEVGRPKDPAPFNAGNVMHARIRNQLHDMTVPFDDRSAGFTWFFSFLVKFSQVKKHHGNLIILLDEPGLSLHATAQSDLLRYIREKVEPHHQVIYSTHSPFMVPADNLASVRTVEDVVEYDDKGGFTVLGTKVGDQVLSTDKDTLFPLQGALGYEITQSLFIGEHTLLVEGPSDLLYLQSMSSKLRLLGRTGLDPRWVVCPTGGVDKVGAFVSLFGGNRLHVAVFTDFAMGQRSKVERLRKSKLLADGHVFIASDFCKQAEADTEDMLGTALYALAINGAYQLADEKEVTAVSLSVSGDEETRLSKRAERCLDALGVQLDHFRPAMWLIQNPHAVDALDQDIQMGLGRFEQLFVELNALLSSKPAFVSRV